MKMRIKTEWIVSYLLFEPPAAEPRTPEAARKEIEWLKKKREATKGESLVSFVERGSPSLVKAYEIQQPCLIHADDFEPRPYNCE